MHRAKSFRIVEYRSILCWFEYSQCSLLCQGDTHFAKVARTRALEALTTMVHLSYFITNWGKQ